MNNKTTQFHNKKTFDANQLELLAGGGVVFSLWAYKVSEGSISDIYTEGYFDRASGVLNVGDWLFVNAPDGHHTAIVKSLADGRAVVEEK